MYQILIAKHKCFGMYNALRYLIANPCDITHHKNMLFLVGMNANNSLQTTQGNLLYSQRQMLLQQERDANRIRTILSTIQNQESVTNTISGQMEALVLQRYAPYRRNAPEIVPQELLDFKMRTANVGNPMPPMTIAKCKGSQFVTK